MSPPVLSRRFLPVVNGPGPLVIFGAADAPAVVAHGLPAGLDALIYHPARVPGGSPELRAVGSSDDGDSVALSAAPSAAALLVCLTNEGREQLAELGQWWCNYGPSGPPRMMELPRPSDSRAQGRSWGPLYDWLLGALKEERTAAARRETQVRAELFDLRREYEQARAAEEKTQALLDRLRLAPWQLAAALEPGTAVCRPNADSPGDTPHLVQPFPWFAEGLAGFDLHVASDKPGGRSTGTLEVVLRAEEEARILGRWRAAYGALAPGWFRFAFDRALHEPLHDLTLLVSWQTESGETPGLTLSPTEAWPAMQATAAGASLHQSLAMRVWRGLPGTRLSVSASGPREARLLRDDGDEIEYELSERDFARVCETTVGTTEGDFFRFEGGAGFRLHPASPIGRATSAVLLQACGEGVTQVVATVKITHPDCHSPIEFAMCLTAEAAECPRFPEDPARDPRVLGFSGWTRVEPDGQPHFVVLQLPTLLRGSADLHFATRVSHGGSSEWAWADWLRAAVRLRSPRRALKQCRNDGEATREVDSRCP